MMSAVWHWLLYLYAVHSAMLPCFIRHRLTICLKQSQEEVLSDKDHDGLQVGRQGWCAFWDVVGQALAWHLCCFHSMFGNFCVFLLTVKLPKCACGCLHWTHRKCFYICKPRPSSLVAKAGMSIAKILLKLALQESSSQSWGIVVFVDACVAWQIRCKIAFRSICAFLVLFNLGRKPMSWRSSRWRSVKFLEPP